MISLQDSSILYLLPRHISDKAEVKALNFAINRQIKKILEHCKNVKLYANIDELSEKFLDVLALEMNTPFYDRGLDLTVKRRLVKSTLKWQEKIGTTGAVEEIVKAVFGEGYVEEWHEYGGMPFHFKVVTTAPLSDTSIDYFDEILRNVKNIRSKLDLVEVNRNEEIKVSLGVAMGGYFVATDIREGG